MKQKNKLATALLTIIISVSMLFGYAKYKGYDTSGRADISGYPDASNVSSWAQEAMEWTINYGVMSGKGTGNNIRLAPKENASRVRNHDECFCGKIR